MSQKKDKKNQAKSSSEHHSNEEHLADQVEELLEDAIEEAGENGKETGEKRQAYNATKSQQISKKRYRQNLPQTAHVSNILTVYGFVVGQFVQAVVHGVNYNAGN